MPTTVKVFRVAMEWTVEVDTDDAQKAGEEALRQVSQGKVLPDSKITQQFLVAPQHNPQAHLKNEVLMRHLIALDPGDRKVIAERMQVQLQTEETDTESKTRVIAEIIQGSQGKLPELWQQIRKRILHYKRVVGHAETIEKIATVGQTKRIADLLATAQMMGLLTDDELRNTVELFDKNPERASKSKLLAQIIGRASEHDNDVLDMLLERVEATNDDKPEGNAES